MTLPGYILQRLLPLVIAMLMTMVCPASPWAAPVYTVIAGSSEPGTAKFLADLSRIWRLMHTPTADRLAVITVDRPGLRLQRLSRGRGHFAVIDTAVAARELANHEGLAAVALLWPGYLHAIASSGGPPVLRLPLSAELSIAENARYVYEGLMEWSEGRPEQQELLRLVPGGPELLDRKNSGGTLSDQQTDQSGQAVRERGDSELPAQEQDRSGLLLFTAPAPLARVVRVMEEDPSLRLVPVAGNLVEELRLRFPWLQTETLPRGAYPGMNSRLVLPVRYQLIVGRRDLAPATVEKMLVSIYRRKGAAAPINPLFSMLNEKLNAIFTELFPYHPVTADFLGFAPRTR
ncbi:MAG: hypothetical protein O7B79_10000 [SAR324 cluster bacterium]|nr:hypothetical protein [SAR324 cluster bacterium]